MREFDRALRNADERRCLDSIGIYPGLTPVILLLSKDHAAALLDPARPELAIFTVWAGCRGHGAEARRVAKRAMELVGELPAPLRKARRVRSWQC